MNVLILCTGNSARSILGEALFTTLGYGRIKGFSAGSQPTGMPNPLAIATLQRHGHDTSNCRSKSWDEFNAEDAPALDVVITVCDSAASEACPIWPGAPVRAHWGLPDPAALPPGPEAEAAFENTYQALKARITHFLDAIGDDHDPERLSTALKLAHAQ